MSKNLRLILLVSIFVLAAFLIGIFLVTFQPFHFLGIREIQQVTLVSKLDRVIQKNTLNFASFYGIYIFPYDFFPEGTDFRRLRQQTSNQSGPLSENDQQIQELFLLAEELDIRSLQTSKFFPISVIAKAGLDLSDKRFVVEFEGDRPLLRMPPIQITEFVVLDEPLPGWPDYPFSVQLWSKTIRTLRPHIQRLIEQENQLNEVARESASRRLIALLDALGIKNARLEFGEP